MIIKRIILINFLFFSLCLKAEDLSLTKIDKTAHMLGSYALTVTTSQILRKKGYSFKQQIIYSTFLTLAAGIIKETFVDSKWSRGDMYANSIGITGGIAFTWAIEDLF